MLLLKCPRCKNNMKYQPTNSELSTKVKRCVYCGRTYKVKENIVKIL